MDEDEERATSKARQNYIEISTTNKMPEQIEGGYQESSTVKNNLHAQANIPYAPETSGYHSSVGATIQQQWVHPDKQNGLQVKGEVASTTAGTDQETTPRGQAKAKSERKKKPESDNQNEKRLERNRRTAQMRRDKQHEDIEAKKQMVVELGNKNNALRQKIHMELQNLVGLGINDTSAIWEKMNHMVSSYTLGRSAPTREDSRSVPPSASMLPVTLPVREELSKALQLLLQQERDKQHPQLLYRDAAHHLCPQGSSPPQSHLGSPSRHFQQPHPQHQHQQLKMEQQRQRLVELLSIRSQQLQEDTVHYKQQSSSDAQLQQFKIEERQTICQDEVALDQMKKYPEYQGSERHGIIRGEEQSRSGGHHYPPQLEEKRQRLLRRDEIALQQRHVQEQRPIDYRWLQLREEELDVDLDLDLEKGQRQKIQDEVTSKTISQDSYEQQVLRNFRQKLSTSGGFTHEEDHQQQQRQQKVQHEYQEIDAPERNELGIAQSLQEDMAPQGRNCLRSTIGRIEDTALG
uniref:BZIP domain-containing protein n=1 Tax=Chaetoceros debilis TaxID=122233 RepID=A0A7S3Q6E6_9STRA